MITHHPNTTLHLFLGPGGVGKTTTSASLALALAQRGHSCVVITVDPAKRLAQALGLASLSSTPQPIPNFDRCHALWLDHNNGLKHLVKRHVQNPESAQKITAHRLFSIVEEQAGGIEEYLGIELVLELLKSGHYEHCILDTPPSQHALDFLLSPHHLLKFFESDILQAFVQSQDPNTEKQGPKLTLKNMLHLGQQKAFDIFKTALGRGFFEDLTELLSAFRPLYQTLQHTATQMTEILKDPKHHCYVVSSLENYPLHESQRIFQTLETQNILHQKHLILNKTLASKTALPDSFIQTAPQWVRNLNRRWKNEQKSLISLPQTLGAQLSPIIIPRLNTSQISTPSLCQMGDRIVPYALQS